MYRKEDKGNTKEDEDEDVKGTYILLSGTLAVVTLAVIGTTSSPVVHVRCSLYPNIHPLVWLYPHLAFVSIPRQGTTPFSMDDLCHTLPFAFIRVLCLRML
jgi:hypothetical protein